MSPSLILHHIRPFGVWGYSYIAAQVRKRQHSKSHNEWGSRVRYIGFEDYTLVGMRLYCPIADEITVNSATFPSGPDLMSIGVISRKKSNTDSSSESERGRRRQKQSSDDDRRLLLLKMMTWMTY